jgi:molybdate transport system regulatory protein
MVKPRKPALAVQGDLWLGRKGKAFLSANRIDLLESVDRLGSITRAAQDVGLSYKAAWDAVDAMSNLADRPLMIRATGGQHGGGSQLTERLLAQMQAQVHDFDKLNELIKAITMKTSARNQLRGTVKAVHKGAVNADVILDIGDGLEIFANITNEAVEDLGLKPGRAAVALIKASFILLSPDSDIRISARNRLRGTVTEVIPGAVNCEIKMQLAGARVLTAIVTSDALKELGLVKGAAFTALIKASHILIAVND